MSWQASEKTDEDLIAARDFIASDNEGAARDFLDAAFETFEQLSKFPEMGPVSDFKHRALKGMRFFVLPPPFNRWLVFYQPTDKGVDVRRVLYGNINWREEPKRFF
jgi:plasmid stabilization system protein ParE